MILADFLLPGSGSVSLKQIRIRLTKMKRIQTDPDPDPKHCVWRLIKKAYKYHFITMRIFSEWNTTTK